MTRIHYWSDLHLGHEYVAKTRGFKEITASYDGNPISAQGQHDAHVIKVWEQHIRPKDHIWILGDISGGRNEDYALELISQMPGTKHLISGNHDSVSSIHRNGWKHQQKFLKVFASVQDFARHKVQGQDFLLSHYPFAQNGDHKDEERYTEYRLPDWGIPLLHGHVHAAWDQKRSRVISSMEESTPMMNVGVDHWFDRPANTEDIINWLASENVL